MLFFFFCQRSHINKMVEPRLKPTWSIKCLKHNPYLHPAPHTLNDLEKQPNRISRLVSMSCNSPRLSTCCKGIGIWCQSASQSACKSTSLHSVSCGRLCTVNDTEIIIQLVAIFHPNSFPDRTQKIEV